jgi:hypothetical protein
MLRCSLELAFLQISAGVRDSGLWACNFGWCGFAYNYERPCIMAMMFLQHQQHVECVLLGCGWIQFSGLLARKGLVLRLILCFIRGYCCLLV